jgi:ABC-type phosphate/phosphonate transport system substrate-binding protein
VENRLRCVSVGILVVTLLLIAGSKTAAQVKRTVGIKTLTMGVVYQSAPESVVERFRSLVEYMARKLAPTGEIKASSRWRPILASS